MKQISRMGICVILLSSLAAAQATLTLEQCLERARIQSPQIKSAENIIHVAEWSRVELSTTKLPQLKIGASSIYAPSSGTFGYDPALSNGGQVSGQIIVQQSVYDGGVRGIKDEQLLLDIDKSAKGKKLAERDLVFSVKQSFIETLQSREEIHLQLESVKQLREYLDLVRQLSRGGNASTTDVMKTELQLSAARTELEKAEENYMLAKYTLAGLIGSPLDTTFALVGSLTDTVSASTQEYPDTTNLDVAIADLETRHSLLDVEMTHRENYPTVSFIGDAGILTSGDNLRLSQSDRSGMVGYSLGFVVEVPLVNWGATNARVQQKQLDAETNRLNAEWLQRMFLIESRKAHWQLTRLRKRLIDLRAILQTAEDNYLLTVSKYAGGGTLALEVLSAQQLLTDTKLSELQARADIQFLSAKLDQLYTH